MRNDEATKLFQQSDTLYKEGRFTEALDVLDQLGVAFPNEKNVMRPRARCLFKLNRHREARAVCEDLIELFDDDRARQLLQRLESKELEAGMAAFSPDDLLGDLPQPNFELDKPEAIPPPVVQTNGGPSPGLWIGIGVAAFAVIALGLFGLASNSKEATSPQPRTSEPATASPAHPPPQVAQAEASPEVGPLPLPLNDDAERAAITVPLHGATILGEDRKQYYVHPFTGANLPIINGAIHVSDPDTGELLPLKEGPYFYTTGEVTGVLLDDPEPEPDSNTPESSVPPSPGDGVPIPWEDIMAELDEDGKLKPKGMFDWLF